MWIHRHLLDSINKTKKSILLLGPRQTGKSTLFKKTKPDISINLAHEPTFLECASNPSYLDERIGLKKNLCILIDEVQRLPSILNTIQTHLDSNNHLRFYITGSSARKLKRGKANLLPGRVLVYSLGPLLVSELKDHFVLSDSLVYGTLPGIVTCDDHDERRKTLSSYSAIYLKEEIQAEALTKDLEGFARFLKYTAATAGEYLDVSKLSTQAQIKRPTASRLFEIMEDTLILFHLESFAKTERRRLVQHPRYFFFDNGVLNGLLGNFQASVDRQGMLFEHFVVTQIYHASNNHHQPVRLSSYRTEHSAEVDLIAEFVNGDVWAIEIKASKNVGPSDFRGFKSFESYFKKPHRKIVIYMGAVEKTIGDVCIASLPLALDYLFKNKLK